MWFSSYASKQTSRQRDRQTGILIATLYSPRGGDVSRQIKTNVLSIVRRWETGGGLFAGGRCRRLDRSFLEALRTTHKTLNDVAHFLADVLAQSRRHVAPPACTADHAHIHYRYIASFH